MRTINVTEYGPGGFDPSKPDGNVLSRRTTPAAPPSVTESLVLAARLTVVDKVRAGELSEDDAAGLVSVFPDWQPGLDVAVGEVYAWDGTLVEVIQAHTTQADWTPDKVPALFRVHRTDDGTGPIPWQPGISLAVGEQVTYEGVTYTVVQSHTTQTGWEPPSVPALFTPA